MQQEFIALPDHILNPQHIVRVVLDRAPDTTPRLTVHFVSGEPWEFEGEDSAALLTWLEAHSDDLLDPPTDD